MIFSGQRSGAGNSARSFINDRGDPSDRPYKEQATRYRHSPAFSPHPEVSCTRVHKPRSAAYCLLPQSSALIAQSSFIPDETVHRFLSVERP